MRPVHISAGRRGRPDTRVQARARNSPDQQTCRHQTQPGDPGNTDHEVAGLPEQQFTMQRQHQLLDAAVSAPALDLAPLAVDERRRAVCEIDTVNTKTVGTEQHSLDMAGAGGVEHLKRRTQTVRRRFSGPRGGDGSDDHFAAQHRKHAAQALHDQKQRQQRADPGVQGSQDTHQRSSLRSGLSIHDQPVVTSLLRRAG